VAKRYREVRKALRDAGWTKVTGSHEWWAHPDGRTTTLAGGGKGQPRRSEQYPRKHSTSNRSGGSAVITYAVIYERADDGSWHARAAEFPAYSCADTREEVEQEIRASIELYLEGLAEDGRELPPQSDDVGIVTVEVPSVLAP
jgi:predicted RNase H-like HicB family nuclease